MQRRCKQAGLPQPAAVHLVSNIKGTGIKELLSSVQEMVGSRGDVWVVGAQNAGKSSLINAMQKLAGAKASQQITTAAQPGTNLGKTKPHVHHCWKSGYMCGIVIHSCMRAYMHVSSHQTIDCWQELPH